MEKDIILSSESFQYPTKKEREYINNITPTILRFNTNSTIKTIDLREFEDYLFDMDVAAWEICINNRIGTLEETYIYVQTHYSRFKEFQKFNLSNEINTDRLLLDYYIEIFYYYYFSTKDIIAQLLFTYYQIKSKNRKIYLNLDFITLIPSENVKEYLITFLNNTKNAAETRNAFTHRFTPTQLDTRFTSNKVINGNRISIKKANKIDYDFFILEINYSMNELQTLINKLIIEIN